MLSELTTWHAHARYKRIDAKRARQVAARPVCSIVERFELRLEPKQVGSGVQYGD